MREVLVRKDKKNSFFTEIDAIRQNRKHFSQKTLGTFQGLPQHSKISPKRPLRKVFV